MAGLDWEVEEPQLTKAAAKILLNLAALGLGALVRGGTLLVGAETRNGATEIAVHASGPRIDVTLPGRQVRRGRRHPLSQTLEDMAIQGGISAEGPAGLFLGLWGSSLDFGEAASEGQP
mgnify:CR=1 FL=1